MAISATDKNGLIGAFTGFGDAVHAWQNNEPNSGQALAAASVALVSTIGSIIDKYPTLKQSATSLGIYGAIASFELDVSAYNDATAKGDVHGQNSAILGMIADSSGALAGGGALFAAMQGGANVPLDGLVGASATISATASSAKYIYDTLGSEDTKEAALKDIDATLAKYGIYNSSDLQRFEAEAKLLDEAVAAAEAGDNVTLASNGNSNTLTSTITPAAGGKAITLQVNADSSGSVTADGHTFNYAAGQTLPVTIGNDGSYDIKISDPTTGKTTYELIGNSDGSSRSIFTTAAGTTINNYNSKNQLTSSEADMANGSSEKDIYDTKTGTLAVKIIGNPDGSGSVTTPDSLGTTTKTYNSSQQLTSSSHVNNDGSYEADIYNPATGVMAKQVIGGTDGSVTVVQNDNDTGQWLMTTKFDRSGDPIGQPILSPYTQDVQFVSNLADTVATQLITQFIFKNNLPASMAAQAFANAGIKTVEQTFDANGKLDASTFSANFIGSLTGMAEGMLGADLGKDLFKALGLPTQIGATVGNAIGAEATIQLAAYVASSAGYAELATALSSQISNVSTLGSLETAGVSFAASYIDGKLDPLIEPNGNPQGEAIGGAIGSVIGTYFGGPLGTVIGSFLGSLVGGLFGGGGGVQVAIAFNSFDPATQSFGWGGVGSKHGPRQTIIDMQTAAINIDNGVLKAIGGQVDMNGQKNSGLGYYNGTFYFVFRDPVSGDEIGQHYDFSNPGDDLNFGIISQLQSLTIDGGNPYMKFVLGANSRTTAQDLLNDLNVAADYSRYVSNPLAFDVALAMSGDPAQFDAWKGEYARAMALGLGSLTISGTNSVAFTGDADTFRAYIAGYQKLWNEGSLTSLTLTNTGTTPIIKIDVGSLINNNALFANLKGAWGLEINDYANVITYYSGVLHQFSNRLATLSLYGGADSQNVISNNFDAIQDLVASSHVTTINLMDDGDINMSIAQVARNYQALSLIKNRAYNIDLSGDTDISVNFDALQKLVAVGNVSAINLLQTGDITISATQVLRDMTALSLIKNRAYNLNINSPIGDVLNTLDSLQNLVAGGHISAIRLTNFSGTIGLSAKQSARDADALLLIQTPFFINITDSASNVGANLDRLQILVAAGKLTALALSDAAPTLNLRVQQILSDAQALSLIPNTYKLALIGDAGTARAYAALQNLIAKGHVSTVTFAGNSSIVNDTAANIWANIGALDSLVARGWLSSINITNGGSGALSLNLDQFNAHAATLSKITNAHNNILTIWVGGNLNYINAVAGDAFTATGYGNTINVASSTVYLSALGVGNAVIGNNSTVFAGGNRVVLGGQNDTVYMNNGTLEVSPGSKFLLIGDGDTITANGSAMTLLAPSDRSVIRGNTITMTNGLLTVDAGETFSLTGTGDTINAANADTIFLASVGATNTLKTQNTGVTIVDGSTLNITGGGNGVAMSNGALNIGDNSSLGLTGNNDVVHLGRNVTLNYNGNGSWIYVDNTKTNTNIQVTNSSVHLNDNVVASITGNNDGIYLGSNNTLNYSGNGSSIYLQNTNTTTTVKATNSSVYLNDNDMTSIAGDNDGIYLGSNNTLNYAGNGSNIYLRNTNTTTTVKATNSSIHLNDNDVASITGNNDAIYLGSNNTLSYIGNGSWVHVNNANTTTTMKVTNSSIYLGDNDTALITGINDAVYGGVGDTITMHGNGNSFNMNNGVLNMDAGVYFSLSGSYNLVNGHDKDSINYSGHNSTLYAGSGSTLTATGLNNAFFMSHGVVTIDANETEWLYGDYNLANLAGTDALHYSGNNSTIKAGNGSTVFISGQNNALVMSNTAVNIADNDVTFVTGNGDGIYLGNHDTLNYNGQGSGIFAGTSDTIHVSGQGVFVHMNNGTLSVATGGVASGELDLSATNASQVWFKRQGNDLDVMTLGTGNTDVLSGWYNSASSQLHDIKTADGSMIDTNLTKLVQAMATYSASHASFNPATATVMPTDATLQSTMAAAWHH